ncbi:response regulator transcription factor [Streptomyces sp. NBC_00525]|uniref:response regulator transcription factor n=1 Tax=Streptomyces sp. NBC_00525 TaxID=2903660 RepID=UPI002E8058A8|nr:LuxR C-terminal-related transcriptional regulator [Streptomyces sp. NBC_00525]WUC95112.1 LuxR C-terminal-related transcriptional regulator [Streptomyces sp. NBC_00525]
MGNSDKSHRINEHEARLLQLLYAGYEDARVARALGLSHRTVQRHVKRLMLKVGVNSRLALGARAQELGWLSRSGERGDTQGPETSWEQHVRDRDAA